MAENRIRGTPGNSRPGWWAGCTAARLHMAENSIRGTPRNIRFGW